MTKTELHPDQMYIEGLANNNSAVIQSIYKVCSKVVSYIRNNSGDEDPKGCSSRSFDSCLIRQSQKTAAHLSV
jgi:hypothetical protein